jgi:FtsP/CotA-like multicopper oxidase with cupredoxin domain
VAAPTTTDFPLRFGGTFWMHSHQGLQEQALLAAPLIIHDARDRADQREIVVMLADFSFTPAEEIFAGLRKGDAMAGMATSTTKPVAPKMTAMGSMPGTAATPDLNDVKYDAFLCNDRTLSDPEAISVEPGEKVLLRVINSSSMSAYHLDLGVLSGDLIAVDGFKVRPVAGRRFPIAVAQRLDIRVTLPREPAAHPILAILEGERSQTGVILKSGGRPRIKRVPGVAAVASPPLNLDLERSLRATEPLAPRKADRVHQVNLTGQMASYVWSINGIAWTKDVPPLPVANGERVELVFRNETPMQHPMHLHGHEFQVVEIDGKRFPGAVRDTVLVTPRTSVVAAFDANNPGWWALHCHLLYHLDAGMFTTLRYV